MAKDKKYFRPSPSQNKALLERTRSQPRDRFYPTFSIQSNNKITNKTVNASKIRLQQAQLQATRFFQFHSLLQYSRLGRLKQPKRHFCSNLYWQSDDLHPQIAN